MTNTAEMIAQKFDQLPASQQVCILDFIDFLIWKDVQNKLADQEEKPEDKN